MLRKKEISIILLIAVFCGSLAWAEAQMRTIKTRNPKTGELITHQVPVVPKEADPYDNASVLVEAFVVRVSTAALADLGVNPIGQAPEGISILKILACLDDPEKAEVVSGAKVTACQDQRSKVSSKDTIYLKKEQDIPISPEATKVKRQMVEINPYDSGRTFSIVPQVQSDEKIRVQATFTYSGIVENEDKMIPPDQISFDWTGVVTAHSGKPIIASGTQDDENVTFLILAATIQDTGMTEMQ